MATAIGIVYTLVTAENKMLMDAAKARGAEVEKISDAEISMEITTEKTAVPDRIDIVLSRSSSLGRSLYSTAFFESCGVPVLNKYAVQALCSDKALTSIALARAGVPTPKTYVAFTPESVAAADKLGYPCVMKPVIGSWARLVTKIGDPEVLRAVTEHREELGSYMHKIYYLQQWVEKPGRDIRAIVVGDEVIAAIYRNSGEGEWITNTARGGIATNCPVTGELAEICLKASDCVGRGVLGVDLMETDDGLVVHEINHSLEFRNSVAPTGVDIPGKIIDYATSIAKT
jgi:[lysine-biosynthesis-protein LysW]--L-2-aminoadipate ligase